MFYLKDYDQSLQEKKLIPQYSSQQFLLHVPVYKIIFLSSVTNFDTYFDIQKGIA